MWGLWGNGGNVLNLDFLFFSPFFLFFFSTVFLLYDSLDRIILEYYIDEIWPG